MKDRYYEQEKVLLSVVSLCFGILVFIVYLTGTEHRLSGLDVLIGAAIGLGASLLYALSGVLVVRLYERMRSWAYRGDARPLTGKEKLRLAAFWPITLLTSLVVYLFLGIINRTF
jgi:hypothetical protein